MFSIFKRTNTKKVSPWDGARAHIENTYRMFAFMPFIDDVHRAVKESRFEYEYVSRCDAEHWETLLPTVRKFAKMSQTVKPIGSIEEVKRDADFLVHMLNAFKDDDRFIVAKLAWGGGAA